MNKHSPSTALDENKIEELLTKIHPVPSEQYHKKMIQASWRVGQGQSGKKIKNSLLVKTAFAMIVFVIIATPIATPQGQAFAQNVLRFFNRAESKVMFLPSDQIASPEDAQSIPTAQPPSPLVSVTEAEARAGFDAAELPIVPDGFNYLGARLYGNAISIEYEAQGRGGNLIIMQSQDGFIQSDWDKVPADAIVPVKIGELDGEFAQGTFVVYPGETSARWYPDAPILHLRWIEDGIWFEMAKFGGVESIAHLDQAGMIALAESLMK